MPKKDTEKKIILRESVWDKLGTSSQDDVKKTRVMTGLTPSREAMRQPTPRSSPDRTTAAMMAPEDLSTPDKAAIHYSFSQT